MMGPRECHINPTATVGISSLSWLSQTFYHSDTKLMQYEAWTCLIPDPLSPTLRSCVSKPVLNESLKLNIFFLALRILNGLGDLSKASGIFITLGRIAYLNLNSLSPKPVINHFVTADSSVGPGKGWTDGGLICKVWKGVMNLICCAVWLWEVPFTLRFVSVASPNQTWPWLGCHQIYATWKPLQTKVWLLLRNNLARWKEIDGCVHRAEKRRIKSSKRMHSRMSCL